MHKVTVYKEVAIAEWRYDIGTKARYADGYLMFEKKIELPFAPFAGLRLQQEGWLPGPLKIVSFNMDSQEFSCYVEENNDIPDKLEAMKEDEEKTEDDIAAFVTQEIETLKWLYRSLGWKLINSSNQGDDR